MTTHRVKALVLAAGLGTRLRPLTDRTPKCLIPIADRPLLDYWVENLIAAGVRHARVNTHSHAEQVRAYLDRVNEAGALELSESYEPRLLGSAGTIAANADLADDADQVILVYADNFSTISLARMLEYHRSHPDPITMLLFQTSYPRACGIAAIDAESRVISFVEKPAEPTSNLANAGVYIVDREAYREIAAMNAFDLGYDVVPRWVGRMRGWVGSGYHRDIGTAEALGQARQDAREVLDSNARVSAQARPAVFLDRDGTMIQAVHYLSDPDRVRLLPTTAPALRRFHDAGYACVVVTNQSAVGRGILDEGQLHRIHDELNRQLAREGASIDAIFYSTHVPANDDRTVIEHPDRKPGPGMILRAAQELNLDISASWMVGDMISDVLTGINAGCRGSVLLSPSDVPLELQTPISTRIAVVGDLLDAAAVILESPVSATPLATS